MSNTDTLEDIKLDEKIIKEIKEPSKYNIIFLNDNVTPMDWVIKILMEIFHYSEKSAEETTIKIHNEGSAIVGTYSFEIAEQKLTETITASKNSGFPFNVKIEQEG